MARKKRQAPDVPSSMMLNPASENVPNVSPLPLPTIGFTRDKADQIRPSQYSNVTSFAELKRPPPPPRKDDNSKPKSFGFSLLRNKSTHRPNSSSSSSDYRNNNISRTQSFLSVPHQEKNFSTLPININNFRRSPSPKSYPAPPIPTMAQPNFCKEKNNSTSAKLSPRSNAKVNGEKTKPIQFNFEERILLENDIIDLDDDKFAGLGGDNTESTTRLSSPDSSRQSVSQDSGVVSDIDVKDYDNPTPTSSIPTSMNMNESSWTNPRRYSRHNSMNCGRHSSISGGDTFSSRSVSGSSEDSDSTDAGSEPSLTSYPDSPASIRSITSSVQNGLERAQEGEKENLSLSNFPPPPPPPPPPAFQDLSLSYNPENNYPDSLSPPPPPSPPPLMSCVSTSSRLDEINSVRGTLRRTKKDRKDSEGDNIDSNETNEAENKYQYHMSENRSPDIKTFSAHDVDDYESESNFAGVKVVMNTRNMSDNSGGTNHPCSDSVISTTSAYFEIGNETVYSNSGSNDQLSGNSKQQTTIRSHRGTVRGVRNRVRQGIATFLLKDPILKNFADTEKGKIVMYVTTLGVVRDHLARCQKVRHILRTLLIRVEERDIFMCKRHQLELRDRINATKGIKNEALAASTNSKSMKHGKGLTNGSCEERLEVPQLFVEGQYFGDAETIENLNETGELRQLLRPFKSLSVTTVCKKCGGFGLLPCPICNGSKKSVHRNNFTERFVALRCSNCDESALVKCDAC